jgi:hypothetical protein
MEDRDKTIEDFLKARGFVFKDKFSVEHQGETQTWEKQVDGVSLFFSWFWDNQGGESFWEGELGVYFDFNKFDKFSHPIALFGIRGIHENYLFAFERMEQNLIGAYQTLKPL